MASIFDKISDKTGGVKKSSSWYRSAVASIADKVTARKLYNQGKINQRPSSGRLNLFFYDPKFKETLPYYDTFPLVLPLQSIRGGFMGINFHYLSPGVRFNLLNQLQRFASNNKFDSTTRLDVSYAKVGGFEDHNFASSCVCVINPEAETATGLVQIFWDVEYAADYLTFLKKKV